MPRCEFFYYLFNDEQGHIDSQRRQSLIWISQERMSGAPCFYGTLLPVSSLFENLENGVSIDEWLDAFPSVTREQAIAVLEYARNRMLEPVA